ncbi:MAG TPA: hypothetical protein VFA08_10460 [Actinomycetota bacterium]|nr:hypothetical protein [Actinomycetota bacterium]
MLDENIVRLAQLQEDDKGKSNPDCLELILRIDRNCHSLVFPYSAWKRYVRHVESLPQSKLATPRVLAILAALLLNADKDHRFLSDDDLPPVPEAEDVVKPADLPFVQAAAAVNGAILATTDGPLRIRVAAAGIDTKYSFIVEEPAVAVKRAGP